MLILFENPRHPFWVKWQENSTFPVEAHTTETLDEAKRSALAQHLGDVDWSLVTDRADRIILSAEEIRTLYEDWCQAHGIVETVYGVSVDVTTRPMTISIQQYS